MAMATALVVALVEIVMRMLCVVVQRMEGLCASACTDTVEMEKHARVSYCSTGLTLKVLVTTIYALGHF